ncbi:MAG TPA: CesT family type III secretion system chaperone [Ramlibacter sp.]|uniref:CesT family type III secretion system chaperone n=1 Tax=Ramlibacter sp. TaxID=1917967 RepID=UPI002CCFC7B7|nr:CesT family type III secretion system chaperone [Ramlibacter sp.]HVZ45033.1 CesT family type III secretion system chaperone [Ramlibacter sp.]
MSSLDHGGFAGYLLRERIDPPAPRSDGAVALVFDGNMRVLVHPAARGDVVLEAQLRSLPPGANAADEVLMNALDVAGRREELDADYLVLAPEEDRLLLQQRIAADAAADEFEAALGRFLDALTGWRAHFGVL